MGVKMKKIVVRLIIFLSVLTITNFVFAATLYLKSGKTVNGSIIEETDEYIKIDFYGVPLKYYRDSIARIEGEARSSVQDIDSNKNKGEKQRYNFKLGSHDIGENNIEFDFPENMDTLSLFNLKEWKGPRSDKAKLVVNLYDKNHNLISSEKSVCVSRKYSSFGSMVFDRISKETVKNVAYFSISVENCGEKTTSISARGYTSAKGQLEKIYTNYLNAIDKESIEEIKKYMLQKKVEEMETMAESMSGLNKMFEMMSMMSPKNLKNIEEGIKDTEAVLSATGPGMLGGEAKITIIFKKEDGVWKIYELETNESYN